VKNETHKPQVNISDHALVRYFERVLGFNIEGIRDSLVTEELREQVNILGDGIYQSGEYHLIIRNKIVVTLIPKNWKVTTGIKKYGHLNK